MGVTGGLKAAIVDYGLGNLFSVKQALKVVGLAAAITSERAEIEAADLVILPGVGAYGDAMAALKRLDLAKPLKDLAAAGKPLVGICLGQQLLLSESSEFGIHEGLDIIPGKVVRFENPTEETGREGERRSKKLKVPQVGWNRILRPAGRPDAWDGTPLADLPEGAYMYFVHSFYTVPDDPEVVLSVSRYGDIEFCSSLRYKNVFAFQFHPERSGPRGLSIYRALAEMVGQGG